MELNQTYSSKISHRENNDGETEFDVFRIII